MAWVARPSGFDARAPVVLRIPGQSHSWQEPSKGMSPAFGLDDDCVHKAICVTLHDGQTFCGYFEAGNGD